MVHFLAFAPGRGKWRRHYENGGANEIHLPLPGANGKLLPYHLPLADILSHSPLNLPLEKLISLKNQIKIELEMTSHIFAIRPSKRPINWLYPIIASRSKSRGKRSRGK